MPTKRVQSTALCTGTVLIVIGGNAKDGSPLKSVEIMNTVTKQWSTAADLPAQPAAYAPVAVCGECVYIVGNSSMNTSSLATLIQSFLKKGDTSVWNEVAAPPVKCTTCVSIYGQLLAIGGMNSEAESTTAIHMYNSTADSWEVISHMGTPRLDCIAAVHVLPNNQLMVHGRRVHLD
jgi:N-acetylneuraminic acid mutarotase